MSEDTRYRTQQSNSSQRDKLEGGTQEAGGRLKESVGALTGDQRMKAEGEGDQARGAARRKKGTFKDRLKAWIDRQ